jgi:hypothetical protein
MPMMPRIPGKPKKIAYKILGKPANIQFSKSVVGSKVNKELVAEETIRVR